MQDLNIPETDLQRSQRLETIELYNRISLDLEVLSYDVSGQDANCLNVVRYFLETQLAELQDRI
jgi:hypothetical protein